METAEQKKIGVCHDGLHQKPSLRLTALTLSGFKCVSGPPITVNFSDGYHTPHLYTAILSNNISLANTVAEAAAFALSGERALHLLNAKCLVDVISVFSDYRSGRIPSKATVFMKFYLVQCTDDTTLIVGRFNLYRSINRSGRMELGYSMSFYTQPCTLQDQFEYDEDDNNDNDNDDGRMYVQSDNVRSCTEAELADILSRYGIMNMDTVLDSVFITHHCDLENFCDPVRFLHVVESLTGNAHIASLKKRIKDLELIEYELDGAIENLWGETSKYKGALGGYNHLMRSEMQDLAAQRSVLEEKGNALEMEILEYENKIKSTLREADALQHASDALLADIENSDGDGEQPPSSMEISVRHKMKKKEWCDKIKMHSEMCTEYQRQCHALRALQDDLTRVATEAEFITAKLRDIRDNYIMFNTIISSMTDGSIVNDHDSSTHSNVDRCTSSDDWASSLPPSARRGKMTMMDIDAVIQAMSLYIQIHRSRTSLRDIEDKIQTLNEELHKAEVEYFFNGKECVMDDIIDRINAAKFKDVPRQKDLKLNLGSLFPNRIELRKTGKWKSENDDGNDGTRGIEIMVDYGMTAKDASYDGWRAFKDLDDAHNQRLVATALVVSLLLLNGNVVNCCSRPCPFVFIHNIDCGMSDESKFNLAKYLTRACTCARNLSEDDFFTSFSSSSMHPPLQIIGISSDQTHLDGTSVRLHFSRMPIITMNTDNDDNDDDTSRESGWQQRKETVAVTVQNCLRAQK